MLDRGPAGYGPLDLSCHEVNMRSKVCLKVVPAVLRLAEVDRPCPGKDRAVRFGETRKDPVRRGVL
jgi:hypothetical protein